MSLPLTQKTIVSAFDLENFELMQSAENDDYEMYEYILPFELWYAIAGEVPEDTHIAALKKIAEYHEFGLYAEDEMSVGELAVAFANTLQKENSQRCVKAVKAANDLFGFEREVMA